MTIRVNVDTSDVEAGQRRLKRKSKRIAKRTHASKPSVARKWARRVVQFAPMARAASRVVGTDMWSETDVAFHAQLAQYYDRATGHATAWREARSDAKNMLAGVVGETGKMHPTGHYIAERLFEIHKQEREGRNILRQAEGMQGVTLKELIEKAAKGYIKLITEAFDHVERLAVE